MQISRTHGWVGVFVLLTCFAWNGFASAQLVQQNQTTPIVTSQQIQQLQADETIRDRFVIVDVRSVAESNVSVIPGAITKAQFERKSEQHQSKAIIVYCTSGFRSAKYANKLKQKGWNAWNYKGSILDWCKHKLPLTTVEGTVTKRVHTYSVWNRVPSEYTAVR